MSRLQVCASQFEQWVKDQALPLWASAGFNESEGASHESLSLDGFPDIKSNIRVRVQARQIFVFAMAYNLGWFPAGRALAERIGAFVEIAAAHPTADCGYTHLLGPDYSVIDQTQDLYDHSFFVLAFAWCYRAFNDKKALEKAEKLVAHLDTQFFAINSGWLETPAGSRVRRQNPHMHLFEAFMSLYEATHDARWLARAGEIFTLFKDRFFSASDSVLYEYFSEDWIRTETDRTRVVEPGHMLEWVWLLRWYERLTGHPVSRYTDTLYAKALEIGLSDSGLLYDEVTPEGRIIKASKRCWAMTEFVKASIAQARNGHIECEEKAADGIERLFRYYLDTRIPGAYIDQRGEDDEILVSRTPASTMYHFIVAAAEVSAYCRERFK